MPIRVIQPLPAVESLVRAQLQNLARNQGLRSRALAGAPPQALALSLPHPVFNLSLDDAAKDAALESAAMTGWRYLVTDGNQVLAAAEASATGPTSRATFSHTNEGSFVQSAAAALASAETWPDVKKGRFALGLLRVPALYVMALWLRDEDGQDGGDLLVPLAPAPAPLVAGQKTMGKDFESALRILARSRGRGEGALN